MRRRYDWEAYANEYIFGLSTLEEIAQRSLAPTLKALQDKAKKEGWNRQRKLQERESSKLERDYADLQARYQLERKYDTVTEEVLLMATRSKAMASVMQQKAVTLFKNLTNEKIAAMDGTEIVNASAKLMVNANKLESEALALWKVYGEDPEATGRDDKTITVEVIHKEAKLPE